jgi:hypothetical protein
LSSGRRSRVETTVVQDQVSTRPLSGLLNQRKA